MSNRKCSWVCETHSAGDQAVNYFLTGLLKPKPKPMPTLKIDRTPDRPKPSSASFIHSELKPCETEMYNPEDQQDYIKVPVEDSQTLNGEGSKAT